MKKVKIVFQSDESCEMENLLVNGESIGFGNVWDNHCEDRVDAVCQTLKLLKIPYSYEQDDTWDYTEWEAQQQ